MRAALGRAPTFEEWRFIQRVVSRIRRKTGDRRTPLSGWILVAANVVPFLGVAFWGWDALTVVLLFWMENVIIGVLVIARILCVDPADPATWLRKLFAVPFFCVHYGAFVAAHGAIVFKVIGKKDSAQQILDWLRGAAEDYFLLLALAVLAGSHLFSFFRNYLYRGEVRVARISGLMADAYPRVLVLHVAILSGGFVAEMAGSPLVLLLGLLVLKTWLDLNAHITQHSITDPPATANVRLAR
jgi:hypothetical protein